MGNGKKANATVSVSISISVVSLSINFYYCKHHHRTFTNVNSSPLPRQLQCTSQHRNLLSNLKASEWPSDSHWLILQANFCLAFGKNANFSLQIAKFAKRGANMQVDANLLTFHTNVSLTVMKSLHLFDVSDEAFLFRLFVSLSKFEIFCWVKSKQFVLLWRLLVDSIANTEFIIFTWALSIKLDTEIASLHLMKC